MMLKSLINRFFEFINILIDIFKSKIVTFLGDSVAAHIIYEFQILEKVIFMWALESEVKFVLTNIFQKNISTCDFVVVTIILIGSIHMRSRAIFSIRYTVFLLEGERTFFTCIRDKSWSEINIVHDCLKKSAESDDKVHGFAIGLSVPEVDVDSVSFNRSIKLDIKFDILQFCCIG